MIGGMGISSTGQVSFADPLLDDAPTATIGPSVRFRRVGGKGAPFLPPERLGPTRPVWAFWVTRHCAPPLEGLREDGETVRQGLTDMGLGSGMLNCGGLGVLVEGLDVELLRGPGCGPWSADIWGLHWMRAGLAEHRCLGGSS
eukprot:5754144-Pyramimonas_sp.AAC.1